MLNKIISYLKNKFVFKKIQIIGYWRDIYGGKPDFFCPVLSQAFLSIIFGERHFVLYLRNRGSEYWTAQIIEVVPDGSFNSCYLKGAKDYHLESFNLKRFKFGDSIQDIKQYVIECTKAWIKENSVSILNPIVTREDRVYNKEEQDIINEVTSVSWEEKIRKSRRRYY